QHRQLEHHPVNEVLTARRAVRIDECGNAGRDYEDDKGQVTHESVGKHDDPLGELRQLVLGAEIFEHVFERRNHEGEKDAHDDDGDDENGEWVDHRAADLAHELDVLLDVDGQTIENGIENAADLAGLNEV